MCRLCDTIVYGDASGAGAHGGNASGRGPRHENSQDDARGHSTYDIEAHAKSEAKGGSAEVEMLTAILLLAGMLEVEMLDARGPRVVTLLVNLLHYRR